MRRRDFVRNAVGVVGGSLLAVPLEHAIQPVRPPTETDGVERKLRIQYIRNEIPPVSIPPHHGHSYDDTVPDTLDIAERAKLGVHVLTSITDSYADYEDYFPVEFFRNPPTMRHDSNDWIQICESHMEDLALLRLVTGETLNNQVDPVWMQAFLKSIGPDGLMYIPLKGRPWSRLGLVEVDPVWRPDGTTTVAADNSVEQVTTGEVCGRALSLLTVYYLRDPKAMWEEIIHRMIQRLSDLAIEKGEYAYITGGWEPYAKVSRTAEMPTDFWAEEWNGRVIEGLSLCYKSTGYEPALQLAAKMARFIRVHSQNFDPEGRWLIGEAFKKAWGKSFIDYGIENLTVGGGSANHTLLLLALLEYAVVAKDQDTMEFVRKSFDWAKNPNSPYGVSQLVGWFPEIYLPGYPTCEGCAVGVMISLALKMSRAGVHDYWDDADRWIRNHFAESQLTGPELIQRIANRSTSRPVAWNETADHVAERNVGAFAGWSTGNDWVTKIGIMHCCTGNCSRALYHIWEHILDHDGDALRINLLLNRASKWADVYSYVPYEGRVDLKIKAPCRPVLLRAPEWINSGSSKITCLVKGVPRRLRWEGRYANLGEAEAGEALVVTFPISERTLKEKIGISNYTLVLKGNTVVSIDPPGENGPLYQRAQYRANQARWRKVSRFVPEESLAW